LLSFYLDNTRPWGVNNLVFKDVGMPHVFGERQGWQKPVYEVEKDKEGNTHNIIKSLEPADKGKVNEQELKKREEDYRQDVRNLVNFLDYLGEPAKLERYRLGPWVILFLVFFLIVSYALKKEYWRDVEH
jgi:ubiquinol-cytochrome c reductase cytochrome c1 subunit